MILFDASFKIPSKNDRPLFISISSNRQPDPCQSFSTPSSKKPVSSRIESNRRNTVQWFPASPPRISLNLVFLSCAPRTRARTQTHSYIRVWWPWLYLRRRKRRITLNLSPLLVISRDHETETKTHAGPEWLTRAPSSPLVIFDTVSPLVASVIHRHAKTRGWILWRWNRIWSGGLKEEILF